ncbi:hypothetical protein G9A89_019827 [Geosiphon pyriformis]|nr:hypothetical protein G9A89_019827 [Geosiphon pyriformis]
MGWTKIRTIPQSLSKCWVCQYMLLDYVRNDAFSGVMREIVMEELLLVVGDLPDGKATGLSSISNELWKHSDKMVLRCLAWVLMIPKPYDWDGIFMNTCPIALIETVRKILSKVLSDQISFVCGKFGVLYGDNFSVLKGTSIQSPVFAVGAVVEDALKKDRELWLVLQDMQKAYDSRIKMCNKFIRFFGSIHEGRFNRVMTDFGLSDGYHVCDSLDQGERIFYDPLLCEVKRHEQIFGYRISSKFILKSGQIEGNGGLSSYFAAGAFVDDTIWNILDIASEFFVINDISINNEKTVAIPINQGVRIASLSINGLPVSIAKKGKAHHYLGIFLFIKGLSKPSVAKVHFDVCFFVNVVLRKAITDKQFSYLVSAILQPIVSYCTQFSFVLLNVCNKWDVMLRKSLKSKTGLSHDFFNEALCYPSLYGLKFFEQVQSEEKLAALISFSNSSSILGQLFKHRLFDLQVLEWSPLNPLQFPIRLCVSPVNNFLVGMVKIFLCNELSLSNRLPNAFCSPSNFPVFSILESSLHFNSVYSLKHFGVAFGDRLFDKKGHIMSWATFRHWKKLGPRGPVLHWFMVVSDFFCGIGASLAGSVKSTCLSGVSILDFKEFFVVVSKLHEVWSDLFEVFTDGSLKNLGSADVASGVVAFFSVIDMSIGISVNGLLSSTMAKLQAIALSLECVPSSCTVIVHADSQVAIDVCISEMSLSVPDFHSSCWLERCQIFDLVYEKNLSVHWVKVKGHSGVVGNVRADAATGDAVFFHLSLPVGVQKCFLVAKNTPVSSNTCYFVRNLYKSVCCAWWETGPGRDVIFDVLIEAVDWDVTVRVWHPDSHMFIGFTSQRSSCLCMYLMKAVHQWLSVAVRKCLYDKLYPGVLCLLCHKMELLDHVFTCSYNVEVCKEVLVTAYSDWLSVVSPHGLSFFAVLQSLGWCSLDVGLYSVLCKEFVLREWCKEAVEILDSKKEAVSTVVGFVGCLVELHHSKAWLARLAFRVRIEKTGLVGDDGLFSGLSCCLGSLLPDKVVRMLGVAGSFAVNFGHHRSYIFFSGLNGSPSVDIGV